MSGFPSSSSLPYSLPQKHTHMWTLHAYKQAGQEVDEGLVA